MCYEPSTCKIFANNYYIADETHTHLMNKRTNKQTKKKYIGCNEAPGIRVKYMKKKKLIFFAHLLHLNIENTRFNPRSLS